MNCPRCQSFTRIRSTRPCGTKNVYYRRCENEKCPGSQEDMKTVENYYDALSVLRESAWRVAWMAKDLDSAASKSDVVAASPRERQRKRKERGIKLLAEGVSPREVAKQVGLHHKTVLGWERERKKL